MNALLLITTIVCSSLQSVAQKAYNVKAGGKGVYLFSAMISFTAMLFFVFTSGSLSFRPELLPYSLGFGVAYAAATVFNVLALANGPLSLSALILSYSLMLPTLYGLLILKDPVSMGFFPGLALLIVSLFLINKKTDTAPITFKWVICVSLSFIANGMCSITQKIQQTAFDGAYKNEFMVIALVFVFLSVMAVSLLTERKEIVTYAGKGWLPALASGIMNGIVNLFVMILTGRMPVSVMFPLISAGGLVITYFISKLIYKEQLSKVQLIGFALGTLSVIFLSI